MTGHCVGIMNAKTREEIKHGAMQWAHDNNKSTFDSTLVRRVLESLESGVAYGMLIFEGAATRFYQYPDAHTLLAQERKAVEEAFDHWKNMDPPSPQVMVPCDTLMCPFACEWFPTDIRRAEIRFSGTELPPGNYCCGSCGGKKTNGQPMRCAHGKVCTRRPRLGRPRFNTLHLQGMYWPWMAEDHKQTLVNMLDQVAGDVHIQKLETAYEVRHYASVAVNVCTISMSGAPGFVLQVVAPDRRLAQLRATIGFLYCYHRVLLATESTPPVDYAGVWASAAICLKEAGKNTFPQLQEGFDVVCVPSEDEDRGFVDEEPKPGAGTPAPSAGAPAPSGLARPEGPETPQTTNPGQPSSSRGIWENIPNAPGPLTATRDMKDVVRYRTRLYLDPIEQTEPAVKYVPVVEVRRALASEHRTRNTSLGAYTDEELINAFVREAKVRDTREHNGVERFKRVQVDVTTMRPHDNASANAISDVMPLLAVRMGSKR